MKLSALSTYLAEGTFASEYFKYNLRQQASLLPRLLAVSVRSQVCGVEYLWARDRRVLLAEPLGAGGTRCTAWSRCATACSRRLHAGLSCWSGAFRVLEWQDLAPLLRELFYCCWRTWWSRPRRWWRSPRACPLCRRASPPVRRLLRATFRSGRGA